MDVLGDREQLTGVLSFGSRHISDESPNKEQTEKAVRWRDAWVETMRDEAALATAGVRPGSRVVPTAYRKRPVRLGPDGEYVASYAIDDKGAVAGLLDLAARLTEPPRCDVELAFTSREEIGCVGASFYTGRTDASSLIALEVTPVAKEYRITSGTRSGADRGRLVRPAARPPRSGARRVGRRRRADDAARGGVQLRFGCRPRRCAPETWPAPPAWRSPPRTLTALRSPTSTASQTA